MSVYRQEEEKAKLLFCFFVHVLEGKGYILPFCIWENKTCSIPHTTKLAPSPQDLSLCVPLGHSSPIAPLNPPPYLQHSPSSSAIFQHISLLIPLRTFHGTLSKTRGDGAVLLESTISHISKKIREGVEEDAFSLSNIRESERCEYGESFFSLSPLLPSHFPLSSSCSICNLIRGTCMCCCCLGCRRGGCRGAVDGSVLLGWVPTWGGEINFPFFKKTVRRGVVLKFGQLIFELEKVKLLATAAAEAMESLY